MIHDNAEQAGVNPNCFPSAADVGITPAVARKAMAYFDTAMEQADDETVRARVEKASICAYRAMIEAGEMEEAERKDLIEKYIEIAQRHNMTHAAEHKDAQTFFAELRE